MKHQVIIALGTNYVQSAHMTWASARLSCLLNDIVFSRTLWTQDIHGQGLYYMNRLCLATTALSAEELTQALKAIEVACGRTREHVTIDLDLMLYDEQRHHLNDWSRPYIQRLIGDLSLADT